MLATKYQDYMFGLIKKVIDEIGPRPPCSEAERKLGRLLVEEWKPICDRVDVEPFTCSPTAAVGSLYLMALFYLATIILYWFFPPLALAMAAINCSIVFLESFRIGEVVDFVFSKKQGENVVGVIQPKNQASQRVIVSAHMDSAYESTLSYYLKDLSVLVEFVAILGLVMSLGASLAKTLAYFNVFSGEAALNGVGIALIALTPLSGLVLLMTSNKPVPGAMDNMSGVSVVAGLCRYLAEARRSGDWYPERTEVVLLGTSSEEAGLRGAKRYAKRHLEELRAIRACVLNLDGICHEKFLTVVKRETFNGARYDPRLVKMAREVAAGHNWPITVLSFPIPGGSDGSAFALSGIPTVFLSSADYSRVPFNYHTRNDTYEHIRPESLSVMLQLVIDMIQRIDRGETA